MEYTVYADMQIAPQIRHRVALVVWLFAEVGGRAWHEDEVKRGMWDKQGNPLDPDGNRYPD